MELNEGIRTRRSIRQYTDQPLTKETIAAIIDAARFAPSWKNSQTARYYAVLDPALKDRIAEEATMQFSKNKNNIKNAAALIVLATVEGIAGYEPDGSFTTALGTHWQSFDAGIACQTLCLAAHAAGVGSLIMGIFDPEKTAALVGMPEGQRPAALIALGYAEVQPTAPARKPAEEIAVFL